MPAAREAGNSEGLPEGWTLAPVGDVTCVSTEKTEPGDDPTVPSLSLEHIESDTARIIG